MAYNNYREDLNISQEGILIDKSASGRERPWRSKKMQNTLLAMTYDVVDPKKAERLRSCADYLRYSVSADGKKKLETANFCRVRLCPVCTWRRSLKVFSQTQAILNAIKNDGLQYKYIFLTLTQVNVKGEDLNQTLNNMLRAFNALSKYKRFQDVVKGWYRGLEITHNTDFQSPQYDTYHPHIHCLIAVNKSYFTSKKYIKQAEWSALWKKALRVEYEPIIDVRKCKGVTAESIAEVAKYTVKDTDYILPNDWDLSIATVQLLDKVLHKRRLVAFGGVLKEYHKKLNLDDEVDGDLLHIDEESIVEDVNPNYIHFFWASGYNNYFKQN